MLAPFSEDSGFPETSTISWAVRAADSMNYVGTPVALTHDEWRFNRGERT
jgi:hypothetical protein